jgi:fucose permease
MATKTSILIFYLTLSKPHKIFRWATLTTLAVVNVGGLALTILNIVQCRPVEAGFQTPVPESATCTNILTIYLSSAPLNIITDLALLFLPMPVLTSMRLPRKQKTILVITFGFGVFVAVVDVVRIAYLQSAARNNLEDIEDSNPASGADSRNQVDDFSWYAALSFMWSAIEINIGVMCACVPALKPLVSRFIPQWIHDATMRGQSSTVDSKMVEAELGTKESSRQESSVTRPAQVALTGNEGHMDMIDFLTTPDMNELPQPPRAASTVTTAHTPKRVATFFDFVEVERSKNITLMTNRESVFPIAMVTVLFFIWGFAYGLLDVLNAQFQTVAHMTQGQTVAQHSAYFGAYLLGPPTFGRMVFRRRGFKACYIVGLLIYACGTLVFWPSAVLTSFPAFLLSNLIVGLGLSTLEIAANPFIALCGPPEYAEVRLNLSQAVQAVGSVLSPLLAKKVLFKASADSLIDVQWTYLGISFFTIVLAILFYYVPLPEATDAELEDAAARMPVPRDAVFHNTNIKVFWITLALGVFSQFCYVGGQESIATRLVDYVDFVMPSMDGVNHEAVAHTAFAASRFGAALLNIWIKPRYLLLFFYLGAIAFAAACMRGDGLDPAALSIITLFFEGPIFALIYAQSLRGLGRHVKDASALLTAAIGGGGVFPPIMFGVSKAYNVQYAFCVVVASFAFGALFPIWLNAYPAARQLAEPVRDEQARRQSVQEAENAAVARRTEKRKRGMRQRFSRTTDSESPPVEQRERAGWLVGSPDLGGGL